MIIDPTNLIFWGILVVVGLAQDDDCSITFAGCKCLNKWSYLGESGLSGCANPDNDTIGSWCLVQDTQPCVAGKPLGTLTEANNAPFDYCSPQCKIVTEDDYAGRSFIDSFLSGVLGNSNNDNLLVQSNTGTLPWNSGELFSFPTFSPAPFSPAPATGGLFSFPAFGPAPIPAPAPTPAPALKSNRRNQDLGLLAIDTYEPAPAPTPTPPTTAPVSRFSFSDFFSDIIPTPSVPIPPPSNNNPPTETSTPLPPQRNQNIVNNNNNNNNNNPTSTPLGPNTNPLSLFAPQQQPQQQQQAQAQAQEDVGRPPESLKDFQPQKATPSEQLPTVYLDGHNRYRSQHCVGSLTWNAGLASQAQAFTDQCSFGGVESNENLYRGKGINALADTVMRFWYQGYRQYDYNNPGFATNTGHFTQMVWRDNKSVGCGETVCGEYKLVLCKFSPGGNFNGMFAEQVPPPCR